MSGTELFFIRRAFVLIALLAVPHAVLMGADKADTKPKPKEPLAIQHVAKEIEGWTIQVDRRLIDGEQEELGKQSLAALEAKLRDLALVVSAERVADLRKVPIYLDLDHPLNNLQYHPDAGWLRDNGYDPVMTKAVHIPNARRLMKLVRSNVQPCVVLHELAHAYHDRVLGFDYPPVKEAYDKAAKGDSYNKVLHIRGHRTRHYALTNHKEYFAELSEAYFGTNDFYPFVYGELKEHDPAAFAVLEKIWGKR